MSGLIDYDAKPLGAYRCGGKCDSGGFLNGTGQGVVFDDRKPCPKCRVYTVSPGEFYSHTKGVLVRARTAEEAIEIFTRTQDGVLKISVSKHNHAWGKKSTMSHWSVMKNGLWERVLNRPTPEVAVTRMAWRTLRNGTVAVRDWKLTPAQYVEAVLIGLRRFKKEHGLS